VQKSAGIHLEEQLSYSLRRQHVDEFLGRTLGSLTRGASLLDVGGVKQAQRGHIDPTAFGLQVTTLNIVKNKGLDVLADAAWLPIKPGGFDAVLCSEVLEHVLDPRLVLAQINRALKPSGQVIITVPFMFRQHADPTDYGRYTEWFWQQEMTKLGFFDIEIEKQGLFGSVLADMLRHWGQQKLLESKAVTYRVQRWLLPRLVASARKRALRFDSRHEDHPMWSSYVSGFGIRATKRA
jgi:SAM-dependent methyltransferase